MRRYFNLLVMLLVAQLALAAWLFFSGKPPGAEATGRPLLAIDVAAVDRVLIEDADQQVDIARADGGWVLAATPALPADGKRLEASLADMAAVTTEWPVTTTAGARERFEVADENFQRRVRLYRGDELAGDFYLGTSPVFRQVHLRRDGEDAVYAVRLSVSDLPAGKDAWLDKSLLAAAGPDRIEGPDYTLTKDDGGDWALENAAEAEIQLDADKAGQLAGALSALRVQSVATGTVTDGEGATSIDLRVRNAQGSFDYRFTAVDSEYYVQRSDIEFLFSLSRLEYERTAGIARSDLLVEVTDDDVGEAEDELPAAD
jgi:hypothetical protein